MHVLAMHGITFYHLVSWLKAGTGGICYRKLLMAEMTGHMRPEGCEGRAPGWLGIRSDPHSGSHKMWEKQG